METQALKFGSRRYCGEDDRGFKSSDLLLYRRRKGLRLDGEDEVMVQVMQRDIKGTASTD